MRLLNYSSLYCRNRPLVVLIASVCSPGSIIHRKWFFLESFGLSECSVKTGLTDEIVLDRKRKGSCVTSIHIIISYIVIVDQLN